MCAAANRLARGLKAIARRVVASRTTEGEFALVGATGPPDVAAAARVAPSAAGRKGSVTLARSADDEEVGEDGDEGAFVEERREQPAGDRRAHFERRLVRLDLRDRVARRNHVPFALQPPR